MALPSRYQGREDRICGRRGFTLIELLIVFAILGILATIAVPQYQGIRERVLVVRAIEEIRALQQEIDEYALIHDAYPATLAGIGRAGMADPWGNPYSYQAINGRRAGGGIRMDRFLVPINSDYDLFSMGPDGQSATALTAAMSRDDIVRANNGGFVGVAELY